MTGYMSDRWAHTDTIHFIVQTWIAAYRRLYRPMGFMVQTYRQYSIIDYKFRTYNIVLSVRLYHKSHRSVYASVCRYSRLYYKMYSVCMRPAAAHADLAPPALFDKLGRAGLCGKHGKLSLASVKDGFLRPTHVPTHKVDAQGCAR